MPSTQHSEHEERERKYEVADGCPFPALYEVAGVTSVGDPAEHELDAVYFDTPSLDLLRHGVTLRRRTGGDDAGWHLKLPADADSRTELQAALGRNAQQAPKQLLEPVRVWVRDRAVPPIARITTRRREYPLRDGAGAALAKVTDDRVSAERLPGPQEATAWREWEVELVDGGPEVLDGVEAILVAAGASRPSRGSKLEKVMGLPAPQAVPQPSAKQSRHGTGGELLVGTLSQHLAELHRQDARLRADRPDSVHKLRIAARRLRSALTTFRPILQEGSTESLRDELRWLGHALAAARDAQVLREHLDAVVAAEPPELVLGPVAQRIDDELRGSSRKAGEEGRRALSSERYFRLLDALDGLVTAPGLAEGARLPARRMAPRLLQRDAKRLRRAVRDVRRTEAGTHQRDRALHEARKKAKRLRYAAESMAPALGRRAKKYASRAKAVQEALGVHQDAVVAREALREYGVRAHLSGENGFTFGRLHALEQQRAERAETSFGKAWKSLPHKHLRRWLRG